MTCQLWSSVNIQEIVGEAEVDQFQIRVFVLRLEHEVLRLEVSVRDPVLVAVEDGLEDLAEERGRHLLAEEVLLNDPVEQLSA
eukprot:CAMPEP_0168341174 /NCGR_PEP_ID=MMETSP0213-20121227/14506_1 /TAXON_ID=151035 /ORGANISM="Euplotes harpa, Strain FSP1.4" /LENGTH=82 /DNA_ID=CAMNT_0008347559 /DNA_START=468 /DNA_END=713 /DNA_ORIENTATION=-